MHIDSENLKKFLKKITPQPMLALYRRAVVLRRFVGLRNLLEKNRAACVKRGCVVVLGNGPSIGQLDLPMLLAGSDVIVMNSFYRHPDAQKLNIVAYCVGELGADVALVEVDKVLKVPSQRYWFSPDFIKLLAPLSAEVHLYMPGNDGALSPDGKTLDLSRPAPYYETTAQLSIMVALGMGYRRIVLLGFDHNFLASGNYLDHFYNEDGDAEASRSKLYVDGADYHALIQNCERMWARYKRIEVYAQARGVEIFNCGANSYLDVFQRRPLASALILPAEKLE